MKTSQDVRANIDRVFPYRLRKIASSTLNRFQTPRERLKHRLKRQIESKRVSIGRFTYGLPKIYDWGEPSSVSIGDFCSIAEEVVIFSGGEHRIDWISTYPFKSTGQFEHAKLEHESEVKTKGNVVIGSDVWIGHGAMIMSGVRVGHGSVVGSGAIVTKDVQPYEIVAGVPAKSIGFRFDETTRMRLLQLSWWNLEITTIEDLIPFLLQEPTEKNLEQINRFIDMDD